MSGIDYFDDKYFNKYFALYQKARELEKSNRVDEALEIYLQILKNYDPLGTSYYERPAIILEKQKRYDEALQIANKAVSAIKSKRFNANPEEFEKRIDRLHKKMNKLENTEKSMQKPSTTLPENRKSTGDISQPNTSVPQKAIVFPDWYVSISFGKSSSDNYLKAVQLAQHAPQYLYNEIDGKPIHQAVYSSKPNEYLAFIALYELVSSWKSTFVIINGEIMDRKLIGGLNYCYGDKCRSGNPKFCYGASPATDNPFGCHRFQISAWNNPWWTHGNFDTSRIWHVDKTAIKHRMVEYSQPYRNCPAFSWDRAMEGLASLPDTINPRTNKEWIDIGSSVQPKDYGVVAKIEIDLGDYMNSNNVAPSNSAHSSANAKSTKNPGCATLILSAITLTLLLSFLVTT